jgi:hypothetical protein
MAIQNLSNQYISQSYQNLMQISSSGQVYNGTGSLVTDISATSFTGSLKGSATLIRTAATTATAGSIYYNTATDKLYVHNGTTWKSASFQ